MSGYLMNFSIYTLAMIGLIFFALMVFKKVMNGGAYSRKSNFLGIEDSLSLTPRKTVYVLRAGGEKFLIASDVDRTALIAKLGDNKGTAQRMDKSLDLSTMDGLESMPEFSSVIDFPSNGKQPMMRELIKKLNS